MPKSFINDSILKSEVINKNWGTLMFDIGWGLVSYVEQIYFFKYTIIVAWYWWTEKEKCSICFKYEIGEREI